MCWETEDELYNGGSAFKIACRDARGVMVTLIADSYYGYCKKEVKTQISYSANLFGLCEEEHAGGALVYASYDLGEEFSGDLHVRKQGHSFAEMSTLFAEAMDVQPEGYGIDRKYPDILYVPESRLAILVRGRLPPAPGERGVQVGSTHCSGGLATLRS